MIDFTSSLYLGMKHPANELLNWVQLTTGKPAVLFESEHSRQISQQIAGMQGLQKGLLAPSTLHLYWDLFGFLRHRKIAILVDEKVYPVSKYGIERLRLNNIPINHFRHLNANHLSELIKEKLAVNTMPVIVTDGWCPVCGKAAPLKDYVAIINDFNGNIIIDDTQAFGILGAGKNDAACGEGGGGILQWFNIQHKNIITIISLAKAFGVPMAAISGNEAFIKAFAQNSETRLNSSPVSNADISAGLNALSINAAHGNDRRRKLWNNTTNLKNRLAISGVNLQGNIFPVQSIRCPLNSAIYLNEKLNKKRIKTVLVKGHSKPEQAIVFIIRCDHSAEEIEELAYWINRYHYSVRLIQKT